VPSGSCTFGAEFAELNRKAVALLETLCDELAIEEMRSSGSGCVGPRGDGYVICEAMAADDAAALAEVLHEQRAIFAVVVGRRSALPRVDLLYRLTERLSGKRSSVSP